MHTRPSSAQNAQGFEKCPSAGGSSLHDGHDRLREHAGEKAGRGGHRVCSSRYRGVLPLVLRAEYATVALVSGGIIDTRDGRRRAEEKPLSVIAAQLGEALELLRPLDSLAGDR